MAKGKDFPGFETLGEDIKAARKALGLSRRALAERVNIDPRYLANIEASELSAIKIQKKERFAKFDYMTEAAVRALLEQPDTKTKIGRRDQFLMIFLYDTGARIQEVLDVKICDIRMDKTPTVALHGKGRKIRSVPLMKGTVNCCDKLK